MPTQVCTFLTDAQADLWRQAKKARGLKDYQAAQEALVQWARDNQPGKGPVPRLDLRKLPEGILEDWTRFGRAKMGRRANVDWLQTRYGLSKSEAEAFAGQREKASGGDDAGSTDKGKSG